jgi:Trk K+ transport system NAD-binding subunit
MTQRQECAPEPVTWARPVVITRLYDPQRETIMNKMGLTTISPTTLAVKKIKSLLLSSDLAETSINGTGVSFKIVKPLRRFLGKTVA